MIYKVKKVNHPHDIVTSVPGSKSITNRALLIAALASGRSVLKGCLFSDDSRHFIDALIRLGFPVLVDEDKRKILHDDILNELGINQQMEYSWGKISSDYDARSNVSSIDIMYF